MNARDAILGECQARPRTPRVRILSEVSTVVDSIDSAILHFSIANAVLLVLITCSLLLRWKA